MRYYVNRTSVLVCAINIMVISCRCLNDTDLYRLSWQWYRLQYLKCGRSRCVKLLSVAGQVYAALESSLSTEISPQVLLSLERYDIELNEWCASALPSRLEPPVTLIGCAGNIYACARSGVERYDSTSDTWLRVASYQAAPYQFVVSDNIAIHLYNLEDGTRQTIRVDNGSLTLRQIVRPNQFNTDVNCITKLPCHELLLSISPVRGVSPIILDTKSNFWRDANLFKARRKKNWHIYPSWVDWKIVCDRNSRTLFLLATELTVPIIPPGGGTFASHGELLFLRMNLVDREWCRLASIPDVMAEGGLHLCISDN